MAGENLDALGDELPVVFMKDDGGLPSILQRLQRYGDVIQEYLRAVLNVNCMLPCRVLRYDDTSITRFLEKSSNPLLLRVGG